MIFSDFDSNVSSSSAVFGIKASFATVFWTGCQQTACLVLETELGSNGSIWNNVTLSFMSDCLWLVEKVILSDPINQTVSHSDKSIRGYFTIFWMNWRDKVDCDKFCSIWVELKHAMFVQSMLFEGFQFSVDPWTTFCFLRIVGLIVSFSTMNLMAKLIFTKLVEKGNNGFRPVVTLGSGLPFSQRNVPMITLRTLVQASICFFNLRMRTTTAEFFLLVTFYLVQDRPHC